MVAIMFSTTKTDPSGFKSNLAQHSKVCKNRRLPKFIVLALQRHNM